MTKLGLALIALSMVVLLAVFVDAVTTRASTSRDGVSHVSVTVTTPSRSSPLPAPISLDQARLRYQVTSPNTLTFAALNESLRLRAVSCPDVVPHRLALVRVQGSPARFVCRELVGEMGGFP
jgi:hypothetical protein